MFLLFKVPSLRDHTQHKACFNQYESVLCSKWGSSSNSGNRSGEAQVSRTVGQHGRSQARISCQAPCRSLPACSKFLSKGEGSMHKNTVRAAPKSPPKSPLEQAAAIHKAPCSLVMLQSNSGKCSFTSLRKGSVLGRYGADTKLAFHMSV